MLDTYYYSVSKAQPYYQDGNFNIWKFPASPGKAKKQKRPIILNYSIMTRAYGTCFNKENFIDYFNDQGFDVFLMDWGKDTLFTLSGWTLDHLADALYDKAVKPLLKEYNIENINVFGICIGGLITAHMVNKGLLKDKNFAKQFNKIAFYGSPILGARDLGMAKSFMFFYNTMKPYRNWMSNSGISLFALDMFLMQGLSNAMLDWQWDQFFQEGPKTSTEMISLTLDDRQVPFAAFMDILEEAFEKVVDGKEEAFHFTGDVTNVHFYNLVGDSDCLVMPSASIVDYNSKIPKQFASFQQSIFTGGHFIFGQPGFVDEKQKLASWFADDKVGA